MLRQSAEICRVVDKRHQCEGCAMRQLSVCSALPRAAFEIIRAAATMFTYPKGAIIVDQEEKLDHVYFVAEGLIELYRLSADGKRRIMGFLGSGDLLSGIKNRDGAYCTARTVTQARMCGFPRKQFLDLMQNHSDLSYMMLLTATDEIEAQNDHIVLLGRRRALERLAGFLLIFSNRWRGEGDVDSKVIDLPVPRKDIADYLGLTIESVSRGFTNLKKSGLISIPSRDKVVMENIPGLYAIANLEEMPTMRAGLGL